MCFIKYHISEDTIVELSGGVETLRCVSLYHEPACILMLNLSMVKDMERTETDWSWSFFRDEELGVPLHL